MDLRAGMVALVDSALQQVERFRERHDSYFSTTLAPSMIPFPQTQK
jgi:hypothetical protein